MTHYERVLTTLNHQSPGVIVSYEGFMDINAQKKLLPDLAEATPQERMLRYLDTLDLSIVKVRWAWEPTHVIEEGDNYCIEENEIGTRIRLQRTPWFREYIAHPVESEEDLAHLKLPDPEEPHRYKQAEQDIAFFSQRGYFVQGTMGGFFAGLWYNLRPLTLFLCDLAANPSFARKLIGAWGEFTLSVAKGLLERGVHAIHISEDMGMTDRPWFSPATYERFFFPWHCRLADLCHSYGAYMHMHSHGHIMPLMDQIVKTGVDILNPVGPGDHMDLELLKNKYGDRLVFNGGISKYIGTMNHREIDRHIKQAIQVGSQGGGFIVCSESGIPSTFSQDDFRFYLSTLRKYREEYGGRGKAAGI